MLAGLPILSFLQFLGGIDPNLILAGFVATGVTAASLAGLSIFHSTIIHRTRDAIIVTYLVALAYLLVSGAMWLLLVPSLGLATWPSTTTWASPVTVQDVVEWANAGNVVAACIQLIAAVKRQVPLNTVIPSLLRDYVLFHSIVAIGCPLWAIGRLRSASQAQITKKARKTKASMRGRSRPTMGERPMIWKELWIEAHFRFHWLTRIVIIILVAASLTPAVYIFYENFLRPWSSLSEDLYRWGQGTGTLVSCLLLCAVAVRASGTISGERNRKTYDDLITTLLTTREILFAKWLGSIFAVR